jgi:putative Holliday junction resolvase
MKLLGIDYGTKRIGIAVTDESGTMAFPKATLANDRFFFSSLRSMVEEGKIEKIVIGESLNRDRSENEIMRDVRNLQGRIERALGIPVDFESEAYSSEEAKRIQGVDLKNSALMDASAAAIILNSYIARKARQ